MDTPIITNDAVVLGMLVVVVGLVFLTRSLGGRWTTFYTFVPAILLCYLIPSLMNSFGLISSEDSNLWTVAKNYFLPLCLALMTLSVDLKAIMGLGPKALIMFFAAVVGIILGGPVAIFLVALISPETVGGVGADAAWRGFSTLAGSWIGGGANQTAMLEVYGYNPDRYAAMVAIDIVVANIWMIFLLYGAGNPQADRPLAQSGHVRDRQTQGQDGQVHGRDGTPQHCCRFHADCCGRSWRGGCITFRGGYRVGRVRSC